MWFRDLFLDQQLFRLSAAAVLCVEVFFAVPMMIAPTHSLQQLSLGLATISVAVVTFTTHGLWMWRQVYVTSLVVIWALRLIGHSWLRILAERGRRSHVEITTPGLLSWVILRLWWVFAILSAWVMTLPVVLVNSCTARSGFHPVWDTLGSGMFAAGLLVEYVADAQKRGYRAERKSISHWTDIGLWGRYPHPNYAGETFVWVGLFFLTIPVLHSSNWLVIISPIHTSYSLWTLYAKRWDDLAELRFAGLPDYESFKSKIAFGNWSLPTILPSRKQALA